LNTAGKPISILFVVDGLEFGGGERTFLQLIEGLPKDNFRIYVATSRDGFFFKFLSDKGIAASNLDLSKRINFENIRELRRLIKTNKINIIHSQGGRADFYARMNGRPLRPKIKVVSTIATPVEGYDVNLFRKAIYCFFDRLSERFVDRFLVVSEALRKTMIDGHKITPDKVIRVYNGIELNEYRPNNSGQSSRQIRNQYGIETTEVLIGAIGRLVWQKGFEYLIKSLPEIAKRHAAIKVIFVGDGPYKESLQMLCRQLGVEDKTIFTGYRSDMKEILSAIDIKAIPSLAEGFPMVTLEAMAMEKPIVATSIDGIAEQITDGVEGILVPPKDPVALALAINRIIENKELARSLGSAARKRVEREFTVEKMIDETEKAYRALLNQ
jgi:glycosyltransferase involved in cell wall biosynthesis